MAWASMVEGGRNERGPAAAGGEPPSPPTACWPPRLPVRRTLRRPSSSTTFTSRGSLSCSPGCGAPVARVSTIAIDCRPVSTPRRCACEVQQSCRGHRACSKRERARRSLIRAGGNAGAAARLLCAPALRNRRATTPTNIVRRRATRDSPRACSWLGGNPVQRSPCLAHGLAITRSLLEADRRAQALPRPAAHNPKPP